MKKFGSEVVDVVKVVEVVGLVDGVIVWLVEGVLVIVWLVEGVIVVNFLEGSGVIVWLVEGVIVGIARVEVSGGWVWFVAGRKSSSSK